MNEILMSMFLAVIGFLVAALQALIIWILNGLRLSIHKLRGDVQTLSNKVAYMEGARDKGLPK